MLDSGDGEIPSHPDVPGAGEAIAQSTEKYGTTTKVFVVAMCIYMNAVCDNSSQFLSLGTEDYIAGKLQPEGNF